MDFIFIKRLRLVAALLFLGCLLSWPTARVQAVTPPALPTWAEPLFSSMLPPNLSAEQRSALLGQLGELMANTPRRGFLYEAVRDKQRAYIYGANEWGMSPSVHLSHLPFTETVVLSLLESGAVMGLHDFRFNPPEQADIEELGRYTDGKSLNNLLPEPLFQRYRVQTLQLAKSLNEPVRVKPWFAAAALTEQSLNSQGWFRHQSAQNLLITLAYKANKPIVIVETWRQWAQVRDNMPDITQLDWLANAVQDTETKRQGQRAAELFSIWLNADSQALDHWINADAQLAQTSPSNSWNRYQQQELQQTSQRIAAGIEEFLALPPMAHAPAFVVIPASHLGGQQGVLALLKSRGFQVRDLQH